MRPIESTRLSLRTRVISGLLLLYLLNLCIDPMVQLPEKGSDEVGYNNEIDSLVELVGEELFDCDNLIPESGSDETNNSISAKIGIIVFSPASSVAINPPAFVANVNQATAFLPGNSSACLRFPAPPPRA